MGVITASGKITKSLSASSDGSQTPYGVLADDYDATSADQVGCSVIIAGEVNENSLILGASHTLASIRDGLRALGIFLKSAISA